MRTALLAAVGLVLVAYGGVIVMNGASLPLQTAAAIAGPVLVLWAALRAIRAAWTRSRGLP